MAGSNFIDVSVDISYAQKALAGTSKSLVSIRNQVLGIVGKYGVKAVKNAIRGIYSAPPKNGRKRTGELRKAYVKKLNRKKGEENLYPLSLNDRKKTIFSKAQALSYGARNEKKPKWKITGKGFVQKGWEAVEGDSYRAEIDKMIQKELRKYWG